MLIKWMGEFVAHRENFSNSLFADLKGLAT
nr:hypothetical protein [Mucilaginibacter sp. SP1R1]